MLMAGKPSLLFEQTGRDTLRTVWVVVEGLRHFPILLGGDVRTAEVVGMEVCCGRVGGARAYHRREQRPIRREDVLGRRRGERARGDVVVAIRIRGGRAACGLEHPLAGVIVAVRGRPSTGALCAREAVSPIPSVIEGADRSDIAVVVVGVRRPANARHRMVVGVSRPGV
jgi:hypothetical protein